MSKINPKQTQNKPEINPKQSRDIWIIQDLLDNVQVLQTLHYIPESSGATFSHSLNNWSRVNNHHYIPRFIFEETEWYNVPYYSTTSTTVKRINNKPLSHTTQVFKKKPSNNNEPKKYKLTAKQAPIHSIIQRSDAFSLESEEDQKTSHTTYKIPITTNNMLDDDFINCGSNHDAIIEAQYQKIELDYLSFCWGLKKATIYWAPAYRIKTTTFVWLRWIKYLGYHFAIVIGQDKYDDNWIINNISCAQTILKEYVLLQGDQNKIFAALKSQDKIPKMDIRFRPPNGYIGRQIFLTSKYCKYLMNHGVIAHCSKISCEPALVNLVLGAQTLKLRLSPSIFRMKLDMKGEEVQPWLHSTFILQLSMGQLILLSKDRLLFNTDIAHGITKRPYIAFCDRTMENHSIVWTVRSLEIDSYLRWNNITRRDVKRIHYVSNNSNNTTRSQQHPSRDTNSILGTTRRPPRKIRALLKTQSNQYPMNNNSPGGIPISSRSHNAFFKMLKVPNPVYFNPYNIIVTKTTPITQTPIRLKEQSSSCFQGTPQVIEIPCKSLQKIIVSQLNPELIQEYFIPVLHTNHRDRAFVLKVVPIQLNRTYIAIGLKVNTSNVIEFHGIYLDSDIVVERFRLLGTNYFDVKEKLKNFPMFCVDFLHLK